MVIRHKETGAVLVEVPGAAIIGADLSGRDLSGADLRELTLAATRLKGANLSRADATGAMFVGCDLTGADMSELHAPDARFINTVLTGANLAGASLRRLNVELAPSPILDDLRAGFNSLGALALAVCVPWTFGQRSWWGILSVSLFALAAASSLRKSIQWRRFPGWWNPRLWARLYRAPEMPRVILHGACLCDARMAGIEMARSDLSHADLTGADLTGANLVSANLAGAGLRGADLSLALLINANPDSAVSDETTCWPEDYKRFHRGLDALTR